MNKRICLIILLLTYRSVTSSAQTNVSGFISANTTWDLAGSPYIVIGNTLVVHGYTLTIDPGVVIKFNTDKVIQIDGELIAIGTPQNRIIFTSNQVSPAAGDWAKIHFSDTCVSAVFDISGNYISGSIMKYCDVKYGGGLGIAEIHIITSSPYFSHCTISNSAADGIYSYETTYFIDSSTVKNCSGRGLHFERYYLGNYCNITIQDDSILNNNGGGIKFDGYYSSLPFCNYNHLTLIRRNVFSANSAFALIAPGSQNDSLILSENVFMNNTGNGKTVEFSSTTFLIECNEFIDNLTNGGILFSNDGDHYNAMTSSFNVRNNIFEDNTVNSNGAAIIHIEVMGNNKDITISNNIIQNNSSASGQICLVKGSITCIFQIHNNDFLNNTGQSNIELSSPNGTGSNYTYLNMTNNNLLNPGCQYEFYNDVPYGGPNIHVENNYWGTTNTQHIDSVIYDFFDLANKTVVFYLPALTAPAVVDTTCPVIIPTSISHIEPSLSAPVLFPNPVTTYLTIAFGKTIKEGIIKIYNILGENVLQESIHHASKKEINLQAISNGIYLVKVFVYPDSIGNGERYYCSKIIIEHN